MNGYRHRSAIVAVALVATMGAGAALAADTGLPPGFVKTTLTSLTSGETGLTSSLAPQSLGSGVVSATAADSAKVSSEVESSGIVAIARALRQSDPAGLAAGTSYASTPRGVMVRSDRTSAGFADREGSPLSDLTALAEALTDDSGGQTTAATSGLSTFGAPSFGRLAEASGTLASARFAADCGSSPLSDLTALAAAMSGGERAGLATRAVSGVTSTGVTSVGRPAEASGTLASAGFAADRSGSPAVDLTLTALAAALNGS
jgi:hypothetical protein